MPAPVVLFVYNRPDHTRNTLKSLSANLLSQDTSLIIFSDGWKNDNDRAQVLKVRQIIQKVDGFHSVSIFEKQHNAGLAKSIIDGVSQVLKQHDHVIVLEDDLVTSRNFLSYMNTALNHYKNDPNVFSVTGYNFPRRTLKIPSDYPYDTYMGYRCASWSWATWRKRWNKVDWQVADYNSFKTDSKAQKQFSNGGADLPHLLELQRQKKIDSWAIRFCYAHYKNSMYCVYPIKTLVKNIGLDNSGTHCDTLPQFQHTTLTQEWTPSKLCPSSPINAELAANFYSIFEPQAQSIYLKILEKFKSKSKRIARKVLPSLHHNSIDTDVLFVNTWDTYGGAARAAYRLFNGINNTKWNASFLSLFKFSNDQRVIGISPKSLKGALANKMAKWEKAPFAFYPNRQPTPFNTGKWTNPFRPRIHSFQPQIIHLHWICESMMRLEELSRIHKPIVWTLHDTWAFTGGCHYTADCNRFRTECGLCPQLGSTKEKDFSYRLMRRRKKVYEQLDLTIVTPSRWLAKTARNSSLFRNTRIETIPNGLDTSVFKPFDQQAARDYFDIPADRKVILFGAHSLYDPRKGGDLLIEALNNVAPSFDILTFGEGNISHHLPNINIRSLGLLNDDISLALAYSAADAFVAPSREDNLPNTVAEALSCGTPCVAFNIGGLPEMIDHKKNGYLATPYESTDLAKGITFVIDGNHSTELRTNARSKALQTYDLKSVSQRYLELYRSILESG